MNRETMHVMDSLETEHFHKRTLPTESNPRATLSCDRWSMWDPRGRALRRGVLGSVCPY